MCLCPFNRWNVKCALYALSKCYYFHHKQCCTSPTWLTITHLTQSYSKIIFLCYEAISLNLTAKYSEVGAQLGGHWLTEIQSTRVYFVCTCAMAGRIPILIKILVSRNHKNKIIEVKRLLCRMSCSGMAALHVCSVLRSLSTPTGCSYTGQRELQDRPCSPVITEFMHDRVQFTWRQPQN